MVISLGCTARDRRIGRGESKGAARHMSLSLRSGWSTSQRGPPMTAGWARGGLLWQGAPLGAARYVRCAVHRCTSDKTRYRSRT